jgi:membrane associated rhomboid family serine protease
MPEVACAFHPDRLTAVACSNCGRPICPEDMTPAPVGYQCPICTGRAREGAFGAASYRTRTTVSRQVDRVPLVKMIRGAGITQLLMAANVAVFVAMVVTSPARFTEPDVLVKFGALRPFLPRDEWWRLFTSMFVHIGFLHLLFNMWALMLFGPSIEQRYGRARFLALYIAAGLLGGAASLAFTHPTVGAGASGAVFGILGAWIGFFVRHRQARGASDQIRSLLFLVAINLAIGYSSGRIDNNAHLGGLAGGFIIATVLEQSAKLRGAAREILGLAGFAAVVIVAVLMIANSARFCDPVQVAANVFACR